MPLEDTDELFQVVYAELRRLAANYLRRERHGHTLQPTALVHEAYLELQGSGHAWKSRAHFLGTAALAMRRVLALHARRRKTLKRGGEGLVIVAGESMAAQPKTWDFDLLDQALIRLEQKNPRLSHVVEARVFGGLTVEEAAEYLNSSPATIKRDWELARTWLYREMAE
jgi:RNA polymerase sigma factor (TIGR02999 family)